MNSLKPGLVTLTLYVPTGTFRNSATPAPSVVWVREMPVCVLAALTVAPGTAAPVASMTFARICAVSSCA